VRRAISENIRVADREKSGMKRRAEAAEGRAASAMTRYHRADADAIRADTARTSEKPADARDTSRPRKRISALSRRRFLERGTPTKVYELGMNERTVVVEFENLAKALAAYESPGYQEALRARPWPGSW
jgi:hypothetical protein